MKENDIEHRRRSLTDEDREAIAYQEERYKQ